MPEPDWKTISQAAMQQRDEANRNLCNLQIEMAIMADKVKTLEEELGELKETHANGVIKATKPAKPAESLN